MNETKANPQAYDAAARARLRTLSLELTGLAGGRDAPHLWLANC